MTDGIANESAPKRPQLGNRTYSALKVEHTGKVEKPVFTITIDARKKEGTTMDDHQLLIDLVFKPIIPGLKLRPAESQLLLSYIGEILKEIEREENGRSGE